ncbi:54S ribosomal protein L3 mitochondrial [Malassezia sp. CBS 17886]|nr:54S ribosomal protein L3 mitochondrial [Malassezia sp. CBS 17886]
MAPAAAVRRLFATQAARWHASPAPGAARSAVHADVRLPTLAREHPKLWSSLRAQVPAAVSALGARVHLLPGTLSDVERARRVDLVRTACTHPSVCDVQKTAAELPLSAAERDEVPELTERIAHNAHLATMGNALLGLIASEYFHIKYPHLPTRVLKAFVSAFVGPNTLADVAAELGILAQGVQRWDSMDQRHSSHAPLLSKDVAAQSLRAVVAVLFQELGMGATRGFIHSHMLSRRLDLAGLLKFKDPKRVLSATCRKYNKPLPQSRMIAETGRMSISPVFVVGVWSGVVKLGEGTGSSIRMAEFRAAEDALRRLYLAETPTGPFDVPSVTLDGTFAGHGPVPFSLQNSAAPAQPRRYTPQPLGRTEVLHSSRG